MRRIGPLGTGALLLAIAICVPTGFVVAAEQWKIERLGKGSYPPNIIGEPGHPAPGGLPDGRVSTLAGGDIDAAWYGEPTRRYAHAILGDAVEAGTLNARTRGGKTLSLKLPRSEVFEDRTPRLADLDGDGTVEIITIRSSTSKGASVTIYGLVNGQLEQRASNGFIGRANRWLNIAGIADFDGRPGLEIAFVRTPHIGGTLFFYGYQDGKLKRIAAMDGFSNHAIGAREMRLSATTDLDADGRVQLAVPSNDRKGLRLIELRLGKPVERAFVPLPARIDRAILVRGNGTETSIILGLDDGGIYRLARH